MIRKSLWVIILTWGFLLISQPAYTATYIPANNSNPGKLQFNNIQSIKYGNKQAVFFANDKNYLKIGQIFSLDTRKLTSSKKQQDASFNSKTKKLIAKKIFESPNLEHSLTMLQLGSDKKNPYLAKYKIIELCSKIKIIRKQAKAKESKSSFNQKREEPQSSNADTQHKPKKNLNNPQQTQREERLHKQ